MNNRTRQWFKANEMLDKYDPPYVCTVKDSSIVASEEVRRMMGQVIMIRKSQLEAAKEIYGDDLEVWEY